MSDKKPVQLNEQSELPIGIPVQYNSIQTMNNVPHQNYQHQQNYSYQYQNQHYPQPNQGFMPQHPEMQQQPPHYAYNRPPPILQQNQQNAEMNNGKYRYPVQIRCPSCKLHVTTVVNQEPGNTTYAWIGTCCICFGIPFCLIPYFVDGCLDKNHYCPNCGFNILRKHQSCCQFCE